MKQYRNFSLFTLILILASLSIEAQTVERKLLNWEQKTIQIGAVLEENGPVEAVFLASNPNEERLFISDVFSDCGCTTVDYTKDTIENAQEASIKVRFDPEHRGGEFSKVIIVRTNLDIYGDTLYLEGFNMPAPENTELAYPHRIGQLGFRLPAINMGNIFTNQAKVKYVEIHNFGGESFSLAALQPHLPDYVSIQLEPKQLASGHRGVLIVNYDGLNKNDFGFFDENVKLIIEGGELLDLRILAVVYEYFSPVPKSMENTVPRMFISENEVDFREVQEGRKLQRTLTISNKGQEDLLIKKIAGNCECLKFTISNELIKPGERASLEFEFDTRGRKGIDHKHITIFSNDPINPVRTITIKSSIK
jgi:hypothetical protein